MFLLVSAALVTQAIDVQKQAYAPYSNYHVGAVAVSKEGKGYPGCNVENASFGLTNCAERSAIFNAVSSGDLEIDTMILVSRDGAATPCGACRQVLNEFNPKMKIICVDEKGMTTKETTLNVLLPDAFGPHNLE